MFTPVESRDESTEYVFRKFEGRLSDDTLQQSVAGQGCYGLDWTVSNFVACCPGHITLINDYVNCVNAKHISFPFVLAI